MSTTLPGPDLELLTPKEVAARLRVSESTIYREVRDGVLPGRMVRGKLRLYWPEVLRALPPAPVRRVRSVPVFDVVSSLKLKVQGLKRVERVAGWASGESRVANSEWRRTSNHDAG